MERDWRLDQGESYVTEVRRQHVLARRMIEHEARTKTIVAWTGLSKYRIQKLFREFGENGGSSRHRGIPPCQPSLFFRTRGSACEMIALARLEFDIKAISEGDATLWSSSTPSLALGEKLLDVFELYCDIVQTPRISLEHALLLARELVAARTLRLSRCEGCAGINVVNLLSAPQELCPFCRLD